LLAGYTDVINEISASGLQCMFHVKKSSILLGKRCIGLGYLASPLICHLCAWLFARNIYNFGYIKLFPIMTICISHKFLYSNGKQIQLYINNNNTVINRANNLIMSSDIY